MRSKNYDGAAQQCCYDSKGKLITHGPGAGTPDKADSGTNLSEHVKKDVFPFLWCGGWEKYNAVCPPYNGNNCKTNP